MYVYYAEREREREREMPGGNGNPGTDISGISTYGLTATEWEKKSE